jgi:WD40 repeat protein
VVSSPDGRLFATFGRGLVCLWSLVEEEARDRRYAVRYWQDVSPSADGRLAIFPADPLSPAEADARGEPEGQAVRVHELATGAPVGPPLRTGGAVLDAAFSPDGLQVATLSSRVARIAERQRASFRPQETPGRIRLWDWKSGREALPPVETPSEPTDAAYRPGRHGSEGGLLVVVCADGEVFLIDPESGRWRLERQERRDGRSAGSRDLVRFAPDGRQFVTWGLSGTVRVWDSGGHSYTELRHEASNTQDARFSEDGRLLAVASSDWRATVWDVASARPAASPIPHDSRVSSVRFSADGRHLLTASGDGIARVWDWREGRLVDPPIIHRSDLLAASFCPDERWIVTSSASARETGAGGALRFWERCTSRPATPPMDGIGTEILFPFGGSMVAVGCGTGFLYLIDLRDFEALVPRDPAPEDLRLLGEILSGQRIAEARRLVQLTPQEWMDRWRQLRRRRPELVSFDRSEDAARAWHRRHAERCREREEWQAAEWHLRRLAALGEKDEPSMLRLRTHVRAWRFARTMLPWPDPGSFPALDAALRETVEAEALAAELSTSPSPRVDFCRRFPEALDGTAAYAARAIFCERPRKVWFLVGSDDAIRVWVNGSLIHESLVRRSAVPDQEEAEAELREGENRLLVEVANDVGPWALFLRIEDGGGQILCLTDDGRLEPLPPSALGGASAVRDASGIHEEAQGSSPSVSPSR